MYNIVIIDDEPWALIGLQSLIDWEEYGFSIVGTFTDSEEALGRILEVQPDLVFTDIRMPKISGTQLIARIKERLPETEIVIISAYRDFEAAKEGIKHQVLEYLLKPFEENEVAHTVQSIRDKLDHRRRVPELDFSRTAELLPEQKAFLSKAACFRWCSLFVVDRGLTASLEGEGRSVIPVPIAGVAQAFLVSARHRDNLPACTINGENPCRSMGRSSCFGDFSELPAMFREARFSLEYGFLFSENETVRKLQLFLCQSSPNISLTEISDAFFLSESYLSALFKKHTQTTITAFVQRTRAFCAARMLIGTQEELKEISYRAGYSDYSYFGKIFKRYFGMSPEAYRSRWRAEDRP